MGGWVLWRLGRWIEARRRAGGQEEGRRRVRGGRERANSHPPLKL